MPEEAKEPDEEVVKAREFDLTKFVKIAAPTIPIVIGAVVAVLKEADVEMTDGIWIGVLGLAAVVLFGACVVMAADLIARALATGMVAKAKAQSGKDGTESGSKAETAAAFGIVAAAPGTLAWLKDDDEPRPVLAIAGDGEKSSAYLVAAGNETKIPPGKDGLAAIDGAPSWRTAEKIRAVKPAKWKP